MTRNLSAHKAAELRQIVTDTHPLIWWLADDPRLSPAAEAIFTQADAGKVSIIIPPIVVVEMIYLSEKGRIPAEMVNDLLSVLKTPTACYELAITDVAVIEAVADITRSSVPELPDRVITATAKALGVPLITMDRQITSAGVVSIVW